VSRIQSERTRWELVEVGAPVLIPAEEIVQGTFPMRALDAVHVASLTTFQAAARIRIPFVTGDATQRNTAAVLGLDVIWIG
jgi:hypothetical protein